MEGKVRLTQRVTTTDGRQRLPDLIQQVYGEKCIVIFRRYGRDLAALVPLEMASPPPDNTLSLDIPVCERCAMRFPDSFASEHCNRPECDHRQALQSKE